MRYLLDTSAILAHFRDEPGTDEVQELFERDDAEILLCSVTLAELARRLRELGSTPAEAWQTIEEYRQVAHHVVPVDEALARESDRLLLATSARLPLADALIAAAAGSRGAVLVHRDAHMRFIPPSEVGQLDLATTNDP